MRSCAEAMTARFWTYSRSRRFETRAARDREQGASVYPDNAALAEDHVKQADAAMYRAKDAGRRTSVHNRACTRRLSSGWASNRLRQALERKNSLVYQPIVALTSQEIVAAEALLRWEHPTRAPRAGSFHRYRRGGWCDRRDTRWVLEKACEQTVATRKLDLPEFRVAVNVGARPGRARLS